MVPAFKMVNPKRCLESELKAVPVAVDASLVVEVGEGVAVVAIVGVMLVAVDKTVLIK